MAVGKFLSLLLLLFLLAGASQRTPGSGRGALYVLTASNTTQGLQLEVFIVTDDLRFNKFTVVVNGSFWPEDCGVPNRRCNILVPKLNGVFVAIVPVWNGSEGGLALVEMEVVNDTGALEIVDHTVISPPIACQPLSQFYEDEKNFFLLSVCYSNETNSLHVFRFGVDNGTDLSTARFLPNEFSRQEYQVKDFLSISQFQYNHASCSMRTAQIFFCETLTSSSETSVLYFVSGEDDGYFVDDDSNTIDCPQHTRVELYQQGSEINLIIRCSSDVTDLYKFCSEYSTVYSSSDRGILYPCPDSDSSFLLKENSITIESQRGTNRTYQLPFSPQDARCISTGGPNHTLLVTLPNGTQFAVREIGNLVDVSPALGTSECDAQGECFQPIELEKSAGIVGLQDGQFLVVSDMSCPSSPVVARLPVSPLTHAFLFSSEPYTRQCPRDMLPSPTSSSSLPATIGSTVTPPSPSSNSQSSATIGSTVTPPSPSSNSPSSTIIGGATVGGLVVVIIVVPVIIVLFLFLYKKNYKSKGQGVAQPESDEKEPAIYLASITASNGNRHNTLLPAQPSLDPGHNPSAPSLDPGHNPPALSLDPGHNPPGHNPPAPSLDPGHNPPGHNPPAPSLDPGHNPPAPSLDPGHNPPGHNPPAPSLDPGHNPPGHNPPAPSLDPGHNPPAPSLDPGHNPPVPSLDPGHNPPVPSLDPGHNPPAPSLDPGHSPPGHNPPAPFLDPGHNPPAPSLDPGHNPPGHNPPAPFLDPGHNPPVFSLDPGHSPSRHNPPAPSLNLGQNPLAASLSPGHTPQLQPSLESEQGYTATETTSNFPQQTDHHLKSSHHSAHGTGFLEPDSVLSTHGFEVMESHQETNSGVKEQVPHQLLLVISDTNGGFVPVSPMSESDTHLQNNDIHSFGGTAGDPHVIQRTNKESRTDDNSKSTSVPIQSDSLLV